MSEFRDIAKIVEEIRRFLQWTAATLHRLLEAAEKKKQAKILQSLAVAVQHSSFEKGGLGAWLQELETNPTIHDIAYVREKVDTVLESLIEIRRLIPTIQIEDMNLAKELGHHIEHCIIFFKKYVAYDDTTLMTNGPSIIVQSIEDFSEQGSMLMQKILNIPKE